MLKLFCIPGRLLAKLFSREKKRAYRSVRSKPVYGPGIILVSLAGWLALAAGVLFAVDKAGLLKQVLDVGVGVTQGTQETETPPADPEVEPGPEPGQITTGSASGGLSVEGQSTAGLPSTTPGGTERPGGTVNTAPAVEIEQWLVVLHSIPKNSRNEAERRKTQYRNKGLEVDVLDSGAFPRIENGSWWLVALGPFDDKDRAVAVANEVTGTAKQFNTMPRVLKGM